MKSSRFPGHLHQTAGQHRSWESPGPGPENLHITLINYFC
jgi:hypothetical protein